MPRIQPDEVREIAALARLRMEETETARIAHDLEDILTYMETVKAIDTTGVEPMTHAVPFDCPLRDDRPRQSLSIEEAVGNAPRSRDGFFEVPRIVADREG